MNPAVWQSLRKPCPGHPSCAMSGINHVLRDSDTSDISMTGCMKKKERDEGEERRRRIRKAMATYQNPIFVASLNDDARYSVPTV